MNHLRTLLLVALLFLAGCAPALIQTPTPQLTPASPILPATPTNIAPITSESIATIATETSTPFPVTEAPPTLPTATPGAMQLFFPTVIPVEGAEYRPPLYPIPWALSSHDHFYFDAPIAAAFPGEPEWDYPYGGTFFGPNIIHTGVDLPAPRGTDVLAAAPGTVVWAGYGLFTSELGYIKDPYGMAVAIYHDFGYQDQPLYTIYAHMEEIDVVVGQWLNTGDVIGKVGSTGNATGPHLHFEVRLGENSFYSTRNPVLWMAPPQGYGVLAGRVMSEDGITLKDQLVSMRNLQSGKTWNVYTYASDATIHSDAYYNENVALGDLPAGVYQLNILYAGMNDWVNIQILPGQITYFTFYGLAKYFFTAPPTPSFTETAPLQTPQIPQEIP
ncbi:MAG: peptidoglycan DD-metalloendopeptidase family protein [Anaerolineales bacterium]